MLEEELKEHRRKLKAAINDALTSSSEISSLIQEVRTKGYDVFLIIEATVGLNPSHDTSSTEPQATTGMSLRLTTQDERFLRQLKIDPE